MRSSSQLAPAAALRAFHKCDASRTPCMWHVALQELEAGRRLPRGVYELGEEDMGRLASACKESGLEPLFLTALKLGGGTV